MKFKNFFKKQIKISYLVATILVSVSLLSFTAYKVVEVISSEEPVSRFSIPKVNELPEDIQDHIQKATQASGFTPHVLRVLAHKPDEYRAFVEYAGILKNSKTSLSKGEKELIIVAVSAINHCEYCLVGHGAQARVFLKKPTIADEVAINYHHADLTLRQKAMLDFATKLTTESYQITQEDFDKLYKHGFNNDDVWNIGAIAAFYGMSNRLMNLMGVKPNSEFYSMGR